MGSKKPLVNGSNLSPMDSRFLSSFSHSSVIQNVTEINGQPPLKRTKLNIDKQIHLSGSSTCMPSSSNNGDFYDDLWGNDPDLIEEVKSLDTTQVFSQVPELLTVNNIQCSAGVSVAQSSTAKPCASSQMAQVTMGSYNNVNRFESVINRSGTENMTMNSQRGVPLRRTASSGWPSTKTFTPNHLNNNSLSNNDHCGKQHNDVNYLQSDFERVLLENKNLKKDLSIKKGEVNLLRDKLSTNQDELNKQKKEYMEKMDSIKQEAEKNVSRLSKELKSLKSQLDVKVMEIETVERRTQHFRLQPDSPNRIRSTIIRPNFSPARANSKQIQKEDHLMCGRSLRTKSGTLSLDLLKEVITPELLKPTKLETTIIEPIRSITNPGLFEGPITLKQADKSCSGNSSKSVYVTANTTMKDVLSSMKRHLSMSCSTVEYCSLSLLSSRLLDISSDSAHKIISEVLRTCLQILMEQHQQLESTVCPQNRYIEREREILHCGYKYLMLDEDYNLLCSKELYNNERGICTRRALALLALLVEVSDFAAQHILLSSTSNQVEENQTSGIPGTSNASSSENTFHPHRILIILKEIVNYIEKQRRTLMFEGVLAGATLLVKNLLQLDVKMSLQSQKVIMHILRGVVFSRPGSLVVHYILQALLAATKYSEITDSLCHNSVKKTFVENSRTSVITYTPDTCILQMLCVLIQLVDTPKKHILSDVFTSWVLTIFYGVQQNPKWLFSVPTQTSCQCRPLVSRLTFTLLGEACCVYPSVSGCNRKNNEKKLLETLLTRGILLVCTLLYHDEHFGVNVDPASVGYYELFLHSMITSDIYIKLNKACREILESLCVQETLRQPLNTAEAHTDELSTLLTSFYFNDSKTSPNALEYLDTC